MKVFPCISPKHIVEIFSNPRENVSLFKYLKKRELSFTIVSVPVISPSQHHWSVLISVFSLLSCRPHYI